MDDGEIPNKGRDPNSWMPAVAELPVLEKMPDFVLLDSRGQRVNPTTEPRMFDQALKTADGHIQKHQEDVAIYQLVRIRGLNTQIIDKFAPKASAVLDAD